MPQRISPIYQGHHPFDRCRPDPIAQISQLERRLQTKAADGRSEAVRQEITLV